MRGIRMGGEWVELTVWMEHFGQKANLWRLLWILLGKHQLQLKHTTLLQTRTTQPILCNLI